MPRLNKHKSLIMFILSIIIVIVVSLARQGVSKNPVEKYKEDVRMIMDEVSKKAWIEFEDEKASEEYIKKYEALPIEERIKQDLEKAKESLVTAEAAKERLQKLVPPKDYEKGHKGLVKHFKVFAEATKITIEKLEFELKNISKLEEMAQEIEELQKREQQISLQESDQEIAEVNEFLFKKIGWKFPNWQKIRRAP